MYCTGKVPGWVFRHIMSDLFKVVFPLDISPSTCTCQYIARDDKLSERVKKSPEKRKKNGIQLGIEPRTF